MPGKTTAWQRLVKSELRKHKGKKSFKQILKGASQKYKKKPRKKAKKGRGLAKSIGGFAAFVAAQRIGTKVGAHLLNKYRARKKKK